MRPAMITFLSRERRYWARARPMPPAPPVMRAQLKERVGWDILEGICFLGELSG